MKSSIKTLNKRSSARRTRHVPKLEYFAQIFSSDLNQRLYELLRFDASISQENRRTEDGKYIDVWVVTIDQVKTLLKSSRDLNNFDIWQSKDDNDLVKVTTKLRKKFLGHSISRQEPTYSKSELEKMGIHIRTGSGGVGIVLYRIQGSALGEVEKQIGYGPDLRLAIENARKNGNLKVPAMKAKS